MADQFKNLQAAARRRGLSLSKNKTGRAKDSVPGGPKYLLSVSGHLRAGLEVAPSFMTYNSMLPADKRILEPSRSMFTNHLADIRSELKERPTGWSGEAGTVDAMARDRDLREAVADERANGPREGCR